MNPRCRLLTVALLLVSATAWAEGRVKSVADKQVTLSVGTDQGVEVGQTGKIRQIRGVGSQIVTADVATFRVTEVQQETSTAELLTVEAGARVGVGNRIAFDEPIPSAVAAPRPFGEPDQPEIAPPPPPPPPPPRRAPPRTVRSETPAAAAGEPIRVGGQIKPPKRTKAVPPVYPDIARQARVQGVVILECTISPEGKVTRIVVLRSIPLLDEAAADAVEKWEYEPTLLNGVAVPVIMTVTVNFTLNE